MAVAAALGVSELMAGLLPGATSLVAAIGQWIVDHQPPGAKDFVVSLFGTNDKLALEVVIVLAALAIGAGIGIGSARRPWVGPAAFIAFGIVGFFAGLGDELATPTIVAVEVVVAIGVGSRCCPSCWPAPAPPIRPRRPPRARHGAASCWRRA